MPALKALFIGGNGIISSGVSRLAVDRGFDLTLLNRGTSTTRPAIEGARTVIGDASDPDSLRVAAGRGDWDVVVNFQSFLPSSLRSDIDLFQGRIGQYVYISSASAYHKPVLSLPITESTPLHNPFWQYSRDKAASEDILNAAHRDSAFPGTVVRPSHTYDPTLIPFDGGWTIIDRMRRGRPTVVHGDGTSLWTLTHQRDFAVGFVGLLGNPRAVGDTYQITSDEVLTWNEIARALAHAAGVEAELIHATSERIAAVIPEWGPVLLGDKSHSVIFDNSKIKAAVPDFNATTPFWRGAREIVDWYDADSSRRTVDDEIDRRLDELAAVAR